MVIGWVVAIGLGVFGAEVPGQVVYSFETANRKIVELSYDEEQRVFAYRILSKGKVEMEVVDDLKDDDTVFTVSDYYRGGGSRNGGMDVCDVVFSRGGYDYDVYYSWVAPEEEGKESRAMYGVRVSKDGKDVADLKGRKVIKGWIGAGAFSDILPNGD